MSNNGVRNIIEEEIAILFSSNTVKDLCKENCSEFKRGEVAGQISILNKILTKLKNNSRVKDENTSNK